MKVSAPSPSRRRPLRQTLFGQFSIAMLLLMLLLGGLQFACLSWVLWRADDIVLQIEMWNVSKSYMEAVQKYQPQGFLQIQREIYRLNRVNPLVDVYVVSEEGEVVFSFAESGMSPAVRTINPAPIHKFFERDATQHVPIYGDDPENPNGKALFSAARFRNGDTPLILYAVVRGQRHYDEFRLYAENYLARYFSLSSGAAIFISLIIGVTMFYLLSRRLTMTMNAMRAFRDGQLDARANLPSKDELGDLAVTFDQMADRIVGSLQELENRDLLRRELIATISHDLRGPLSNIKAHLELSEGTALPEPLSVAIDTIRRNADQLGDLLAQLFELASLEARETGAEMEIHLIKPLLDDLLISYGPVAKELGITLSGQVDDARLTVFGDLTMLGRILGNLIENALRFTKRGGTITLAAVSEGDAVRISVTDSGSGIPESELPKIFERFYQGEKGKGRIATSGLGLAIVRRLVQLQGSEVKVKSVLDVGSEFYFSLSRAGGGLAPLQTQRDRERVVD